MGAPVRLRHDRHDRDAGGGADGLGAELWEERVAVRLGYRGNHLDKLRGASKAVLPASGGLEGVEVDALAAAGALGHGGDDLGYGADARLLLGDPQRDGDATASGVRLLARLRRCHEVGALRLE